MAIVCVVVHDSAVKIQDQMNNRSLEPGNIVSILQCDYLDHTNHSNQNDHIDYKGKSYQNYRGHQIAELTHVNCD